MADQLIGPIMMDLQTPQLSQQEIEILQHPLIGGVILFQRNLIDVEQCLALCKAIRAIKSNLLIAVDHEGGRVQRLHNGLTRLPAAAQLGNYFCQQRQPALQLTEKLGWLIAYELSACGFDFSFMPVLDLQGPSLAIGDRAFADDPQIVIQLATAIINGLQIGHMASVGKHFPGHGYVTADSHYHLPVDNRSLKQIEKCDLIPFQQLSQQLTAIMVAHLMFPQVDHWPVGFSSVWLRYLRQQLSFQGAIFSDDLSMHGAYFAGTMPARASRALEVGCDMVLVCNDLISLQQILQTTIIHQSSESQLRLKKMRFLGQRASLNELANNRYRQEIKEQLLAIDYHEIH